MREMITTNRSLVPHLQMIQPRITTNTHSLTNTIYRTIQLNLLPTHPLHPRPPPNPIHPAQPTLLYASPVSPHFPLSLFSMDHTISAPLRSLISGTRKRHRSGTTRQPRISAPNPNWQLGMPITKPVAAMRTRRMVWPGREFGWGSSFCGVRGRWVLGGA